MVAMFPLTECLNLPPSQSEDAPIRRDSDAGYSSNGSDLNSPETSVISTSSSNAISSIEYSTSNEASSILSVADDIFSDIQNQNFNAANNMVTTNYLNSRKDSDTCHYTRINVIPDNGSVVSVDSIRLDKSIPYVESSVLKHAFVNGEKVAIRFVSNPRLSKNGDCCQTTSNSLSSFICSDGQVGKKSTLNLFQSKPDPVSQENSNDGTAQHYPTFADGDIDFLDDLASDDRNLNEIVDICNENSTKSKHKEDDAESYFDDLGLMDPFMLLLPETSQKHFEMSKTESPLCGDTMKKRLPHSSEDCSTQELDVGEVSPSPCMDDENEMKNIVNSIGDSTRGPGIASQMVPRFTTEDEAWRSYLENPLTAATSEMMSIHGDEDSAAALGILYDYYKVPREKRILSYQLDCVENSHRRQSISSQEALLERSATNDSALLPAGSAQRSRGHSGSSSIDQDSSIHEVVSVGSDCVSLDQSTIQLTADVSSDYLHVSKSSFDSESKQSLPSLDNAFSDMKHSPSQVMSYGECAFSDPARHKKRHPALAGRSSNPDHDLDLQLSSHSINPQLLTSSTINLPSLFTSRNDQLCHEYTGELFEYTMEAPKSLKQKEGEPTMSYINKGQFYCISLRECCNQQQLCPRSTRVTSVVQVVFGDAKPEDEQLRHWKYWHARQHTAKQRIIDIADYKESCMISDIDEFAHNAIAFTWDIADVAKIFISCNCLSTDFSAQKGIKGLPLHLQIDTYYDNRRSGIPNHRGVSQLKVFCDKGAERKIRDEERKAMRKKQKGGSKSTLSGQPQMPLSPVDVKSNVRSPNATPPPQSSANAPGQNVALQKKLDIVQLMAVADRRPAVYFVPEVYGSSRSHTSSSPSTRLQIDTSFMSSVLTPTSGSDVEQVLLSTQVEAFESLRSPSKRSQSIMSSEEGDFPPAKLPKLWEPESGKKVLLYIRKEGDEVFDGVMLKEPTLQGLKEALQEKYNLPAEKMSKLLKKSKKGILVNLDDNIVCHYSNEDTFVIDITSENCNDDVTYKITLSVV